MKIISLTLLTTTNQLLVAFIPILTAFYHLLISFGTAYTLAHRYFWICSSWTKFSATNFLKNGYPEIFTNKYFERFLDNIHVVNKTTITDEKKHLVLVLLYLCLISLQTGICLKKSLKNKLTCCKLQIIFKNETRLGIKFHFKDRILKDLTSSVVHDFQCRFCS